MDYSADRAIVSMEEDKLGRGCFAKQLGRTIYEYRGEDSLVIGLYGKWGTGKTSIINLALQEMKWLSEGRENSPLVVNFNPWFYSSQTDLISQFFNRVKAVIGKDGKIKKSIGEALDSYSSVFDALSLTISANNIAIAPILKVLSKLSGNLLKGSVDLEAAKEKLEKALRESNRKIVVVIDDIDRLTNSQIKDIFQLVKQVGALPHIMYILAMDREIVARALEKACEDDGNAFLDKIVQIPFEIPALNKTQLNKVFSSKLDDVLKTIPIEIEWDKGYLINIYRYCIEPYINTLRDINRIINTFQFRYSRLYEETSFEDMIGITAMEVLVPQLYKWISCNKDMVCGGGMHSILLHGQKSNDYKEYCNKEFNKLGIDAEKAINSVGAMFPVFANDVGDHFHYHAASDSDIRSWMRVANRERFELYFTLNIQAIPVSRSIINGVIYALDEEDIIKTIEGINNDGNIVYFLDELRALVNRVPCDRIRILAVVLLKMEHLFIESEERGIFHTSARDMARYCIFDYIKKLNTEEERYNVYSHAIENTDRHGLGVIAYELNLIELFYGRLAGKTEDKSGQIISLNQLYCLEREFVDKIKNISFMENIIEVEDFAMAFYLWRSLDKESADEFIKSGFENDIFKLKFVCRMAKRWTGSDGRGWYYDSNECSEYISDEEIYELIQSKIGSNIEQFAESELIKLASFMCCYKNVREKHVNERDAMKIADEWLGRTLQI